MIAKTLSGVSFLDDIYGGVYAGRSFLVSGRSGTGKSTLGFQFVRQGLQQDERCLVLSTMAANDLSILAEALGFSFSMAIDAGNLVLLEYQSFIPGKGISDWGTLPPEGFSQLKEIIEANSVKRVVLDTVLPWIAMPKQDRLAEHIFSFVRSCDRLGITTMMTIPKPVSSMAFRLKKHLEDVTPISILLNTTEDQDRFTWQAVKYLGEKKPTGMIPYTILPAKGFVSYSDSKDKAPPAESTLPEPLHPETSRPEPSRPEPLHPEPSRPEPLHPQRPQVAERPVKPPPPRSEPEEHEPVRFSSLSQSRPSPQKQKDQKPQDPDPPGSPEQPARLASVWKPDFTESQSD